MESTLQEVFRVGFETFAEGHRVPAHWRKAAWSFMHCRTAELGGHIQACPDGPVERVWYNSCKHRSCPQCNQIQIERWLDFQQARLLDCGHHPIIFTLPHELNGLWRLNATAMTPLLFQAVRDTLMELTGDERYLGAQPGFLCALHSWGRSLVLHPPIHCLITDGGLDKEGNWPRPKRSCFLPARVVISPVLANVYLHYTLDLWFERVVKTHYAGEALIIRYADNFVCAFRYRDDAERFYRALPKRLEKYQLQVATDKIRTLRFSRFHPGLPKRFAFLGFELYWERDRKGDRRVMKRTARKKLQGAKRRMKAWIRANRHLPGREFIVGLNRRLVGHYNYFGLRSNLKALNSFYTWCVRCAFKWLNRRGGKRSSFNGSQFNVALKKLQVALPRITEKQRQHVVFV